MSASWSSILKRHCGRHLFEVNRRIRGTASTVGFVVDFSDSLILLHIVDMDTFTLNGYSVLQNKDVRHYRVFNKREFWQNRAVRHFKLTPLRPAGISLASVPLLIGSIGERSPLITIHPERKKPDICYIGLLLSMSPKMFIIDELDQNAEWSGPRRLKFSDVTRVDFGGGYEEALAATALKHPKWKEAGKARHRTRRLLRQSAASMGARSTSPNA